MKSVVMNQAEADIKLLGLEMVSMLVGDKKLASRRSSFATTTMIEAKQGDRDEYLEV